MSVDQDPGNFMDLVREKFRDHRTRKQERELAERENEERLQRLAHDPDFEEREMSHNLLLATYMGNSIRNMYRDETQRVLGNRYIRRNVIGI